MRTAQGDKWLSDADLFIQHAIENINAVQDQDSQMAQDYYQIVLMLEDAQQKLKKIG